MTADLPRPAMRGDAGVFWSALRDGTLRLQRCAACLAPRHPPRPVCARCGSDAREWVAASGHGEVWSSTVVHGPTLPAFEALTPYNAIVVRLAEGPFLVSNLIGEPADVEIGAPVELVLDPIDGELTLPRFRLARAAPELP
jgi:hypothetical protein